MNSIFVVDYFLSGIYPYILLLIFILILGLINKKGSIFFVFISLFLFSALRYNVGYDYESYYDALKYDIEFELLRWEFIERMLAYFSQYIGFIYLFFIVNSFFTLYFLFLALKKYTPNNIYLGFVCYFCLPVFYLTSLSTIRFHLALSIVFWATTFLKDEKWIRFLLIVLCAFLIHSSALVAILFIPLFKWQISRTINAIILISSFFASSIILNIVNTFIFDNYLLRSFQSYALFEGQDVFNKLPLLFHAINIFNLLFYRKIIKSDSRVKRYITIFNISCCLMQMFSINPTLSTRLSRYFFIFILLIIPQYITIGINRKLVKFGLFSIMILLYISQFIITTIGLLHGADKHAFFPYKTFI